MNRTFISDNNLNAYINDTIRFFNNGTENLTLKKNDTTLISFLPPQSSFDMNVTSSLIYFIEESGFIGSINANSNAVFQYVHNPANDKNLIFKVTSKNKPVQASINVLLNNFIMDYNGTADAVLQLQTNETIFGLHLTADKWITFSSNDFDFSGNKIVNYQIKPNCPS